LDAENPEVSILIPCYNGIACIGDCLTSVRRTVGLSFEVILIDNASTDGSLRLLHSFPEVRIISNKTNLGFPVAANQGASVARGKFLAILNQDTEVDPNWLVELTSILENDPSVAICGPKILSAVNRTSVQQMGVHVDRFGFGMYICHDGGGVQDVFMVSGAAMVVRKKVFDLIGKFDREYFMFEDDLDLCWRTRLAGYRVVANPSALVYHIGGGSIEGGFPGERTFLTSPMRRYYSERNTLQTLLKNYETKRILTVIPFYLGMNFVEIGLFLIFRRSAGVRAYLRSLHYNLLHFKSTWKKHLSVTRMRRISDSALSKSQDPHNLRIVAFMKWGVPSFTSQVSQSS